MDLLDRAAILAAKDFTVKTVQTPEWGGSIAIKSFDGATRSELIKPAKDGGGVPDDWMEQIIVASACDKDGNPLFTPEDLPALRKKNAVVLERIFTAAIELNGLSSDTVEKEKGESTPTPK